MVRKTGVQSSVESYQRFKKMVLDTTLPNTQHYKVRIKGKVEQEGVAPTLHLGAVAIEKGDFGSPSTKVANFTYFLLTIIANLNNVQLQFFFICSLMTYIKLMSSSVCLGRSST